MWRFCLTVGRAGLGHNLAMGQFRAMCAKFERWSIPYPGGDRQLCYAPLGTPEADDYLDDMALGANYATINHMLINALVLEAFQEVFPGLHGELVYFISHNIARKEIVNNQPSWVMRKGATRAFPAGHHALKDTPICEDRPPDPSARRPTARLGRHGRSRGRISIVVLGQPRGWPGHGGARPRSGISTRKPSTLHLMKTTS